MFSIVKYKFYGLLTGTVKLFCRSRCLKFTNMLAMKKSGKNLGGYISIIWQFWCNRRY